MIERSIRYGFLAFATALLMSCGGSTGGSDDDDDSQNDQLGNGDITDSAFHMGSFDSGGNFNEGVISANKTSLEAGESANLSIALVDQDEAPVIEETDVFFNSTCINAGTSEVDPAIATNSNGTISVTYTTRGCDGDDTVTARTSIEGQTLTATVTLQTQQAPLGSIQFESAEPNLIGIQGSGNLQEQSVVTFLVTNDSGGPVANQEVDFTLNTEEGGITLSPEQNTTNSDGFVSTTVSSGTVATTVRVTASAMRDGNTISAQSSALAITTGTPDNDSFSISATELNIEGGDFDGATTEINIRAGDRFNNPVPDDTAINFTTEGGSIESTCLTVNGGCSVTLTSQDPRPADGRVTVLATATGEESFIDANPSNGRFDDGETLFDLPEAFRDDNFDGTRQTNEPFRDFNNNGSYDLANGTFEGLLCNGPNECGSREAVHVREQIEIVFSGSSLFVDIQPDPIDLNSGPVDVMVEIQDANGQKPPAGTTVSAETTQGTIVGPSSFEQQSSNTDTPAVFVFRLDPGDEDGDGSFSVEVITPVTDTRSTDSATVDQTP